MVWFSTTLKQLLNLTLYKLSCDLQASCTGCDPAAISNGDPWTHNNIMKLSNLLFLFSWVNLRSFWPIITCWLTHPKVSSAVNQNDTVLEVVFFTCLTPFWFVWNSFSKKISKISCHDIQQTCKVWQKMGAVLGQFILPCLFICPLHHSDLHKMPLFYTKSKSTDGI